MSWDFVTRGPHVLTSRAMFRFLAASERRSTEEGAGLAAEDPSTVDAGAVRVVWPVTVSSVSRDSASLVVRGRAKRNPCPSWQCSARSWWS